jgi:hypothetical protein
MEGCNNKAYHQGKCGRHGPQPTPTKRARQTGSTRKLCIQEGCNNQASRKGLCKRHGGRGKKCSREDCEKYAVKEGLCYKHGPNGKLQKKKAAMDTLLDDNAICDTVNFDQDTGCNKTNTTDEKKKKSTGISNEEVEEKAKKRRKQIL